MKNSKDAIAAARKLLKLSFDKGGSIDEKVVKKIIKSVVKEKPRGYIDLLSAYERLLKLEFKKRQAVVESAVKLEDSLAEKLVADLRKKYGKDLEAEFTVNPDLLGGMRVRVGSDVWDGSLKARLEKLREAFS